MTPAEAIALFMLSRIVGQPIPAGKIKKSANLMFDLVSNLLDVNRIEQGQTDIILAPCDLWDTVRQAVEGYRHRAPAKQIELHFEQNNRPAMVAADATQLVQHG